MQYGLCVVDVDGVAFDEALARVSRRVIATFKHAYFDPNRLAELVADVSRERGEEVDIECYYNDRRFGQDDESVGGTPPTVEDVLAALPATTITPWAITNRATERLFAAVEQEPGSFRMSFEVDTRHLPKDALAAIARTMEELAVAAVRPSVDGRLLSPR
jgi:hypothetical protein